MSAIAVRGAIAQLSPDGVAFADGRHEPFDAIVLATGFRCDVRPLLPDTGHVLDECGAPCVTGGPSGDAGLYFCGQITSPTGQLREVGLEARRIADHAKRHVARAPA